MFTSPLELIELLQRSDVELYETLRMKQEIAMILIGLENEVPVDQRQLDAFKQVWKQIDTKEKYLEYIEEIDDELFRSVSQLEKHATENTLDDASPQKIELLRTKKEFDMFMSVPHTKEGLVQFAALVEAEKSKTSTETNEGNSSFSPK